MTKTFDDRTPIRVLLVDDSYLVRMGVASLLSLAPDIAVVGEASDGVQAIELYRTLRPDVVVADLKMPNFDGVQMCNALKKETPAPRVLVLTQYEGDESIHAALAAGALGYVMKETPGPQLLEAIRTVAAGRRHVPIEIATKLVERSLTPRLTPREAQVLELLCQGMSNRSIGAELKVSERTVGVFVTSILSKLAVKSRTEAVAAALRRGFVTRS